MNNEVNPKEIALEINKWQQAKLIEEGRNAVLKMVARNEPLPQIMQRLCEHTLQYNQELLCSVLRYDEETNQLRSLAAVALPDFYCDAINGVEIGPGVGSCGSAAFLKKRVIVEDINTHPYWNQFKGLALEAGVQACWSEPIIGSNEYLFGTFALYYRQPTAPTDEDIAFIESCANLATIVFESESNKRQLEQANEQLSQTVDQRTQELEKVNRQLQAHLTEKEKVLEINTSQLLETTALLSGLSHEISTPIGNALTSVSILEEHLQQLESDVSTGKISRSAFMKRFAEMQKTAAINKQSLERATNVLSRFEQVQQSSQREAYSTFSIIDFLHEIRASFDELVGEHVLDVSSEDFTFSCDKLALYQVFHQLVENAVVHGFKNSSEKNGSIHVHIIEHEDEIEINFQDDGCGFSHQQSAKIFEPSLSPESSSSLGLNIVKHLVTHNMRGAIRVVPSPVGVRYRITFPK